MSLRARILLIVLTLALFAAVPALVGMTLALLEITLMPAPLRLRWIGAALTAYALGAVLLALLADLLVRRVLRGLEDLSAALRRTAAGEAPPPAPAALAGARETADLAAAYAALAERLAGAEREARRASDALARGERLASVGRIAAGVAHDLKNPIAALVNHARLALEATPADSPLRGDLERIDAEARRAAEIVRALRDLARPPRPEVGPTDLTAVVRSAADLVRRSATVPIGIRGADIRIEADAAMLREAFVNLLSNAVRAASARGAEGRVDVEVRPPAASAPPADRAARVEVRDNGPGIAAEVRARLFEPFVTASEDGTGLGLATARRVVESHGGRIEVETGAGGTAFTVVLPKVLS